MLRVTLEAMAFVKLDCGILDSTLWVERDQREVFITALLMAEPFEVRAPMPGIQSNSLEPLGFTVPPGWYGFVPAAGIGIVHRSGIDEEAGRRALDKLSQPEAGSRSPAFEGRRMVRVDGGYVILNYDVYRQRDYTAAERMRRYRERKRTNSHNNGQVLPVTPSRSRVTTRIVTQAEAEAEAYSSTPNEPPIPNGQVPLCSDAESANRNPDRSKPDAVSPGFKAVQAANAILENKAVVWWYDNHRVPLAALTSKSLATVIEPSTAHRSPTGKRLSQPQILRAWLRASNSAHAASVDDLANDAVAYAVQCFKAELSNLTRELR